MKFIKISLYSIFGVIVVSKYVDEWRIMAPSFLICIIEKQ